MTFRLTNAYAIFMSLMNKVYHPYLEQFIIVFMDDILVYLDIERDNEKHLRTSLQVLNDNKLFAKLSNVTFG